MTTYDTAEVRIYLFTESNENRQRKQSRWMYSLAAKTSDFDAYSMGMMHAMPFCDTILEKVPEELIGNYNDIRAQTELQNPMASAAGEGTCSVLEFMIGAELAKNIPGVSKVVEKVGNAVGKGTEKALNAVGLAMVDLGGNTAGNLGVKLLTGGAKKAGVAAGKSTANIVGDLILDTALDTVPNVAADAADGLEGEKIASNAVKSVGRNLGYNMLGEGVAELPNAVGKIKNRWPVAARYAWI